MLHVEQRWPGSFYAPLRWGTADGCMPFAVCWMYFRAMRAGLALDALTTARGIGLAFGDPGAARKPMDTAIDEAFGGGK